MVPLIGGGTSTAHTFNSIICYMRFPHVPKEDARVMCALSMAFALIAIITLTVRSCYERQPEENELLVSDQKTLEQLRQQIVADSLKTNERFSTHLADTLFAFDPNHTDSTTLVRLGLSKWQVSNMMKYRRKGGRWRSPDDFQRLYGLSESDFHKLRPYIRISVADQQKKFFCNDYKSQHTTTKNEEEQYEKIIKLQEGETLDISKSDTTELKKIPGIGSYYAGKIVKYRERLGGFVSIKQLEEIDGLPPNITRWFTLSDKSCIKKLHINHATFKELIRHPYLDYEQTKDIVNHVRQYGPIHSLHELRLYKEFKEEDFQRLTPYVSFK